MPRESAGVPLAAQACTQRYVGAPLENRSKQMKWITREHVKVDRVACPWLISRFIDPQAQFIYVPTSEVTAFARKTGAIPYDIEGVEFAHEGERCSFDTLLRVFGIAREARTLEVARADLTLNAPSGGEGVDAFEVSVLDKIGVRIE